METQTNVLYAAQTAGRGHLARCAIICNAIERLGGVHVHVIGVGGEVDATRQSRVPDEIVDGPTLVMDGSSRIDWMHTIRNGLGRLPAWRNTIARLTEQCRRADCVIVDFEPLAARAAAAAGRPALIIDNQTRALCRGVSSRTMRWATQLCYGDLLKSAETILTCDFTGELETQRANQVVVPGPVRDELRRAVDRAEEFEFDMFVSSSWTDPLDVIAWASANPELRVCVYAAARPRVPLPPNVEFRVVGDVRFADDFARSRRVVSTAGFQTISECIYASKPVMVMPIDGQPEQQLNARLLTEHGIGMTTQRVDADALDRFMQDGFTPNDASIRWSRNNCHAASGQVTEFIRLTHAVKRCVRTNPPVGAEFRAAASGAS